MSSVAAVTSCSSPGDRLITPAVGELSMRMLRASEVGRNVTVLPTALTAPVILRSSALMLTGWPAELVSAVKVSRLPAP